MEAWWRGRFSGSILVVDNDPEGTAELAARAHPAQRVRYCVESRPGIAMARNRVLDEASGEDILVFIDDDETPRPGWLCALVNTYLMTGATAVAGPVVSRCHGPVDPFVEAGRFLGREHRTGLRTGDIIERAATNNLLLDLKRVRGLGVQFDQRFGLSGGEDTLFTGLLQRRGAVMVWCADAVVNDEVPPERLRKGYVVNRAASLANATLLAELALPESGYQRVSVGLAALATAIARGGQGLALAAYGTVTGSTSARARGSHALARTRGSLGALVGHRSRPYARAHVRT